MTPLQEVLDNAARKADRDAENPTTKLGTRPTVSVAPAAEKPAPVTLFESSAVQQCEVRLIVHRQLEAALLEQIKMAQAELAGVQKVIAGDEALLQVHGKKVNADD